MENFETSATGPLNFQDADAGGAAAYPQPPSPPADYMQQLQAQSGLQEIDEPAMVGNTEIVTISYAKDGSEERTSTWYALTFVEMLCLHSAFVDGKPGLPVGSRTIRNTGILELNFIV